MRLAMVSASRSISSFLSVMSNAMLTERLMVFGSRPTAAQCSSRIFPFRVAKLGVRCLDGLGIERGVGELVITPFESGAAFGPQRPDHLTGLVQPLEPLAQCGEGNTVGLVLVPLPAGAEPEAEAAAGDDVDLRGHLRDHRRMAIRVPQHDGADAEAWH